MISLYGILDAGQGQLFGEPGPRLFSDLCIDPLQATEACLYAALRTDGGDGHHGIAEAIARGAGGIIATRPPELDTAGLSVILVKDVLGALMAWAHAVIGKLGVQVIVVAGSAVRPVTVEAARAVLSTRHRVVTDQTGGQGRISIPLTTAHLTPEDRFVIFNLDPAQPGEMSEMISAAQPHSAVIPQIGVGFSDRFGSPDAFAAELGLIFDYLSPGGAAVINYDDDRARALLSRTRSHPISIGIDGFGADLVAYNIVIGPTRTGFDLRFRDQRHLGRWTPLLGQHQLYAVLGALALGAHYEIPLPEALRVVAELDPLPGQMKPLPGKGGALLIDNSAGADPTTTLSALEWLNAAADPGQRKIFIFGDLDRLGEFSQRSHRLIGQKAAELSDLFITHGADAALAGRAALDHGMDPGAVAITYGVQDVLTRLEADSGGLTDRDLILLNGSPAARVELITRALLADRADERLLPRGDRSDRHDSADRPIASSWVEIDLEALANNVRALKALIGPQVALFAVVKADAYGHGAVAAARVALLNGATYLAVASMAEALALRDAGINAPILVMSYTPTQAIRQAVRQQITVTVYDLELAREYDRLARENGGRLKVHIKIDTGMGRIGVLAGNAMPFFRHLLKLNHLEIEGIYTHYANADSDPAATAEQTRLFKSVLVPLKASGYQFKYIHAANSAATLTDKETHFNAVRCGLALYGLSPSPTAQVPSSFRPVMSWRTVIASVKVLPPGHPVGYGSTYRTSDEEKVAVIPVGYADGLRRAPQHQGYVLVHGQRAPIRGRVSMEKTVISVHHIPNVSIGDEVTLLGTQGNETISADEIAERWGTINYEVVCSVLARTPRK